MSASDTALRRHRSSMRRLGRIYAVAVVAVVAAIGVLVGIAWAHGEVANTTLRTVASAPSPVALEQASTNQQLAWRSSDRIALGSPVWHGTVIEYGTHVVRGRDARTGAVTWSYTRNDRDVCAAIQENGTTFALFELSGNCDEATALDSDTGDRKWTRTFDLDGHPLLGQPAYSMTPTTLLLTTPAVIYAVDPGSGEDRWEWHQPGCSVNGAVIGGTGALISQNCTKPACSGLKYCAAGQQLVLRDPFAGSNSDSKDNPDQVKWLDKANTDVPVSGDAPVVAANTSTRGLEIFDPTSGARTATTPLAPVPPSVTGAVAAPTTAGSVIWLAGTTHSINETGEVTWSAATAGPPTLVSASTTYPPQRTDLRVTAPAANGIVTLDAQSGRTEQTYSVTPPGPNSTVYPLGTGFLVGTPAGTVVYR